MNQDDQNENERHRHDPSWDRFIFILLTNDLNMPETPLILPDGCILVKITHLESKIGKKKRSKKGHFYDNRTHERVLRTHGKIEREVGHFILKQSF